MAHYRAMESKREQFRRYLEKSGVLDGLSNVLVALYEQAEKPDNALEFLKEHLGVTGEASEVSSLRLELAELQTRYNQLLEENQELKTKLQNYEQTADEAEAK